MGLWHDWRLYPCYAKGSLGSCRLTEGKLGMNEGEKVKHYFPASVFLGFSVFQCLPNSLDDTTNLSRLANSEEAQDTWSPTAHQGGPTEGTTGPIRNWLSTKQEGHALQTPTP